MDRILVATDLSARSDRAVLRAGHLARAIGATLRIVHVCDDDLPAALTQTRCEEAEAALSAMVSEAPVLSALEPEIDIEAGHLDVLLPRIARDRQTDLVVLGSHRGRGFGELLGAPTLIRLIRGIEAPVLIVAGRPEPPYGKVSVAWDFSPAAEAAGRAARRVAPDAEMTLVHAWMDPLVNSPYAIEAAGTIPREARDRLRADMTRDGAALTGAAGGVGVEVAIGPPGHVLRRRAQEGKADLLALGRHARTGFARLVLGSTAEDVALGAGCDVLVSLPS